MLRKDATNIGRMDQRIIIQEPITTRSPSGEAVNTWAAKHVLWASISEMPGTEKLANDKNTAVENTFFVTRYVAGITTKMRISYDNEIYNIRSIQREHRTKYLTFKTTRHE